MVETKLANDKIWLFLEQKWKPQIPSYFKNILKVCGYNNGITIAAIGDEDINYMENEVRNGNVTKYFADIAVETVLKDCTKSVEDFTFTLGHRKWLMAIVNFLKVYIEENGPCSLTDGEALEKGKGKVAKKSVVKKKISNTSTSRKLCSRKRKFSEAANLADSIVSEKASIILCESDIEDIGEHIKILMKKTLEKTILSLKKPPFETEKFDENVESVKKRILKDSIKINKAEQKEKSEEEKLEAAVCCYLCSKPLNVFHKPSETNNFVWSTSNFNRHLKIIHLNESDSEEGDIVEEDAIPRKRAFKESVKESKSREVDSSTSKTVALKRNESDNIETNIVQEKDVIRPNRALNKIHLIESDNIMPNIVQEEDAIPSKRTFKDPLKEAKSREANSSTFKAVALKNNESDNIEINIVQEKDAIRPKKTLKKIHLNESDKIVPTIVQEEEGEDVPRKRAFKEPLKEIKSREVNSSTSKAVALKKNESDNIETNIFQEKYLICTKGALKKIHLNAIPCKIALKEPLKEVNNREVNSSITEAAQEAMLEKVNKCNGKSNKNVGPSLVCYSDSSESEEDQEAEISITRDRFLKPKQSKIGQELRENSGGINNIILKIASKIDTCGIKCENASIPLAHCVPVLQNSYKCIHGEHTIITRNTCGFDSIFSIFACLYFDNLNFRAHIDSSCSKFFELIKTFFQATYVTPSSLKKIYIDRNILLKDLYCNWHSSKVFKKNNKISIDCKTGIGGLYAELCLQIEENIASAIEERVCDRCQTTNGKILPFLRISGTRDLHNLQASVDVNVSNRSCLICKTMCVVKIYYNNLLVLEVEPNNKFQQNETISLQNLNTTLHVDGKLYKLYAVIQHNDILNHFTALVRRIDNNWKLYDDIKYSEINIEDSLEIKPFLLFYISINHHNEFKTSFSSFLCGNEIETDEKSNLQRHNEEVIENQQSNLPINAKCDKKKDKKELEKDLKKYF